MLNKHLVKKIEEYNLVIKYSINNKFLSIPKTKFYLKTKKNKFNILDEN